MNCKDVVELLPLFLDAELTPDELTEVEAHLATCSNCQELLAEYRREQQILQSLPLVAPPPTWRAELLAKVSANERRRERPAWRYFANRLGTLAAALLLVVLLSNLYVVPHYLSDSSSPDSSSPEVYGKLMVDEITENPDPDAGQEAADLEKINITAFAPEADSKSRGDEAPMFRTFGAAAASDNALQRRWWFWSSGISVVVWIAAAGYYYYRYRQGLQEQTDQ